MNIWQEVEKRFPALQPEDEDLTVKVFELRSFRRSAFHSGAEWARKEALREAADTIDSDTSLYARIEDLADLGMSAADDIQDEFVKALRALAEEVKA